MALKKEPSNLEAEIAALSCAFLSEEALDKVCEELNEDMFFDEKNKKIYSVIKDLRIKGTPIDSTTVSNELDKKKWLNSIGGIEYLTEIIESEPTAANITHYINIIFEKSILRALIEKATSIVTDCYDEQKELSEIVEDAERNILSINKTNNTKNILFEVTDEKLLKIGGGIVQGMSGSPILQDDKLVGAVTHVVVDNPHKGYGIIIDNMLKESEKE